MPPPTAIPLTVRAYRRVHPLFYRAVAAVDAMWCGFWLGVMDRETLHALDDAHYAGMTLYQSDAHTTRGLFAWEEEALRAFPATGRLLLLGAGGGRESYALARRGYVIEGYECNPALVAYANDFFARTGLDARVRPLPRDETPAADGHFDGVIIGWSAYMLVPGRAHRVAMLRALRSQLDEGAPLLLSCFTREEGMPRFRIIAAVGNVLRRLRGQPPIEPGDDMAQNFVHRFSEPELRAELADGGFTMVRYARQGSGPSDSGWAVGLGSSSTEPAV